MRYAYYPGCSSKSSSREYDISTKAVAKKLGIELIELKDQNCCGTHVIEDTNKEAWLAINARNLSLAEKEKADMVAICSSCFLTSKKVNKHLKEDNKAKERVNKILSKIGKKYGGSIEVKHIIGVLVNEYGHEKLKEKVVKPLKGIKVAPYYGCQIVRPPDIVEFDSPENPVALEKLIKALGGEIAEFSGKVDCCGAPITLIDRDLNFEMTKQRLLEMKEAQADCIVTVCPLCHFTLDSNQPLIEKRYSIKIGLPVLHATQLVGLALGLNSDELGLNLNTIPTGSVAGKFE